MSFYDEMVVDRAVVLGDISVTVVNLNTRQSTTGFFESSDVAADTNNGGLKNVIKSVLWIPAEITSFAQEHKLLITLPDGAREEFTISACGSRAGAFRKVELTQVKQTRMRQGVQVGN